MNTVRYSNKWNSCKHPPNVSYMWKTPIWVCVWIPTRMRTGICGANIGIEHQPIQLLHSWRLYFLRAIHCFQLMELIKNQINITSCSRWYIYIFLNVCTAQLSEIRGRSGSFNWNKQIISKFSCYSTKLPYHYADRHRLCSPFATWRSWVAGSDMRWRWLCFSLSLSLSFSHSQWLLE